MTVPSSQVCGHCGREAPEYSCSRCRSTRFCGQDCFRKAWKQHKLTCQNVSISSVSPVETGKCPAAPSQIGGYGGAGVVVVVPFREQLPLQHRGEQLARFLPHMQRFLWTLEVPARVLVVEQNQDGRKFNRGQLLNVGRKAVKSSSVFDCMALVRDAVGCYMCYIHRQHPTTWFSKWFLIWFLRLASPEVFVCEGSPL